MRLFIVRHGETDWNREGRFQGQQDTDLTAHGLAQAEALADFLRGQPFDAVVSSPLKRARMTAEKIASATGCATLETAEGLTEIHHGDWEGLLSGEVRAKWPRIIDLWHTSPHTVVMPGDGGESLRSVQLRSVREIEAIAARYDGADKNVLVASHDAVIKTLICHFLDAPLSGFWRYQIANCSLTVAELRKNQPARISLMGDAHYLGIGFDLPEQKGL